MTYESARLMSEAMTISSAAMLSSLIDTLIDKGILTVEEEKDIYLSAIDKITETAGDDEEGTHELARELIEQQIEDRSV
jgi:polyhydroxyalkanoate synthesis regulator phasin